MLVTMFSKPIVAWGDNSTSLAIYLAYLNWLVLGFHKSITFQRPLVNNESPSTFEKL